MTAPFLFDSNSFRVLSNYYPARFPSFWERFEQAISAGEVLSVREVHREIEYQLTGGWIAEWADAHKPLFMAPADDEAAFVAEIFRVQHFQALIGLQQQLRGRPVADRFVIASARIRGGCVVTEEARKPTVRRSRTSASTSGFTAPMLRGS